MSGDELLLPVVSSLDGTEVFRAVRSTGAAVQVPVAAVRAEVGGMLSLAAYGAVGDGTTNDTAAVQAAIDAAIATDSPLYVPPGSYRVTTLTASAPFQMYGAGIQRSRLTWINDAVAGTGTTGGSLATGTWWFRVQGLDGGSAVVGGYPGQTVTLSGGQNAISATWPAITGATSYRVYIGQNRYEFTTYQTTSDTSLTITASTGTAGTPTRLYNPMFDLTPSATEHYVFEDISLNGGNEATDGLLFRAAVSYMFSVKTNRVAIEFCYETNIALLQNICQADICSTRLYASNVNLFLKDNFDHVVHGNCTLGLANRAGLEMSGTVTGTYVATTQIYTNSQNAVILGSNARRNVFMGCVFDDNGREGLVCAGDQNVFTAIKFSGSNTSSGSYSDILCTGDKNTFVATQFSGGTPQPVYSLSMTGTSTTVTYLIGSIFNSAPHTTGITDTPTRTFYSDDIVARALRPAAQDLSTTRWDNYVQVTGSTGSSPQTVTLEAVGQTTNINAFLKAKGTGSVTMQSKGGTLANFVPAATGGSNANRMNFTQGDAGSGFTVTLNGTDTNIQLSISGKGTGGTLIESSGSGRLGFLGTTPIAKQTITGAKGSNAALGSLLTALAALGLITDSSSA